MATLSGPSGDPPTLPYTFLGLDGPLHAYEQASVVVLPVPYDATTSYKAGAREGPEAIISASRELEDYDTELGCEPSSVGIYTALPLEPHLGSPEAMVDRVARAVETLARADKLPVVLGGDHSVTIGAISALAPLHLDLSVLYLDAHADFRDDYLGTRWGHASAARRVSEICPVTLVGVRSMSQEEAGTLRSSDKVQLFPYAGQLTDETCDAVADSLSGPVYVSVDLDVLDPSLMAAVGTPEPGGLGWYPLLRLLRLVAERHPIVGFDVVELAPREGPPSCAYMAAKLVYKLIGYSRGV